MRFRGALLTIFFLGCSSGQRAATVSQIPPRVAGAVDRGPAPAGQVLRIVVGLPLRAAIQPGAPLSPSQFADRYAISAAEYQSLVGELAAQGLDVVSLAEGRTTVSVEGTVATVEQAFSTSLHQYDDARGSFRAPAREPQLTGEARNLVTALVGLDDAAPPGRVGPSPQPLGGGPFGSDAPADLQSLYAATGVTQTGAGETVAILAEGTPPSTSDISQFVSTYSLSSNVATQYSQVLLGGPSRVMDTSGNIQFENTLDPEMVLTFAQQANVVHVITATDQGLFTDGISYIVNKLPQAHAVSLSYGQCERFEATAMPLMETLFAQARAQGQTWFAASGDTGTDGCRDGTGNKILSAGYPASSPNVVGVGGTMLPSKTSTTEVAWGGVGINGGAGGGGHSEDFPKPAYQAGVGPYPTDGSRDSPDVAALAGSPGVAVVLNGFGTAAQGTSAAAPMWAGMWALIDQSRGGTGITNGLEELYTLGAAGTGFTDITSGNNGDGTTPGFPALVGFDLATGWGAPNLAALIANWK